VVFLDFSEAGRTAYINFTLGLFWDVPSNGKMLAWCLFWRSTWRILVLAVQNVDI